jgi:spore coat polysaccharide biosynthesis protein SpsF
MKPILGRPVLELLIERLKNVKLLDDIVVATTLNKEDKVIEDLCKKIAVKCFRGSEKDCLGRVLKAAKSVKADLIVETLGDCPLTDPKIIEKCIKTFLSGKYDYLNNALERTYPDGLDVQVYKTKILEEVDSLTDDPLDREHGTYYIYTHPQKYKIKIVKAAGELNWPKLAITLDTIEDYKLIKIIFENLYPKNPKFSALDVVRFLRKNPKLLDINKHIKRKVVPKKPRK